MSECDDRVEQVMESLAAYSAITDTDVNEVALANLSSVMEHLDAPAQPHSQLSIYHLRPLKAICYMGSK